MIPKSKPYKTKRQLRKAAYRKNRQPTRAKAFELDGGRCIWPTCRKWIGHLDYAHEHEVVWRSHQGDPTDVENVVTLCPVCHRDIHPRIGGLKKKLEGSRSTGFRFYERQPDDTWLEVGA